MSDVKRYEIIWDAHEDAPVLTVEIDHSICTDKLLHQINNFFINAEDRYLDGSEGIKILACDVPGVNYDDMEVEEVS
ncbi:DUF2528 family protein [Salmonella enterica]|nr:DUF2528 family protein [Salmonella enterica]